LISVVTFLSSSVERRVLDFQWLGAGSVLLETALLLHGRSSCMNKTKSNLDKLSPTNNGFPSMRPLCSRHTGRAALFFIVITLAACLNAARSRTKLLFA